MSYKCKYLWQSTNISCKLLFCIDIHVCIISKVGINKEKEILLSNNECISGPR